MPMNEHGKTKTSRLGIWFVYLFLSVFVIIGSSCLLYAPVKMVKTALFIRSAASTTGTVTDLHASRGSKTTTFAPVVSFNTEDGTAVEFRSRISSSSSDYSRGEQVQVYYDPQHPDVAEINAFIPLWMPVILLSALGLSFTAAGGGVLFLHRRGAREARRIEAALQQGMKEWETDPDWRSGHIRSATRQEMWFYWLFAVVWNAIAQPTGFLVVPEILDHENWPAAIGLLFPVVGFWLLAVAIRKTLQIRKFGQVVLQMNPSPGSLGGEVGGMVDLPVPYRAGQIFNVSLSCQKVRRQRKSTSEELVWQDAGPAVAAHGPGGTRIAFKFAVPAELPPSSNDVESGHRWVVRLTADLPGIDLDSNFVIPVVATAAPLTSSITVPPTPGVRPVVSVPAEVVGIEKQGDNLLLHYPPRRNFKSGLAFALTGGVFLFTTCMLIVKAVVIGLIMLPTFGLMGLGLVLYALWLFGNSLQVDALAGELVVARRFLGIPVYSSRVASSAMKDVESVRFGSVGAGDSANLIFTVSVRLADGNKMTVGAGIEGRSNPETIAGIIAEKYGLRATRSSFYNPLDSDAI